MRMLPQRQHMRPMMARNVVVLPAPFGPSTYGKWRYQQQKKEDKSRADSRGGRLKQLNIDTVRIGTTICSSR